MHAAIQANIDYWSRFPEALLASPPLHTSFYAVKENGALKVYGVKWDGADLSRGKLFTPSNELELLAQVEAARPTLMGDIGDSLLASGNKLLTIDSFVYNSPVRMRTKWLPSHASSILDDEEVPTVARTIKAPSGSRITVDKQTQTIRFEDESEQSVTIVIESK